MLLSTDTRVVDFVNFVQAKPKNADGHFIGSSQNQAGLLYVISNDNTGEAMLQVWLPIELIEYANAAAGSSGDRAVGIRVKGYKNAHVAADAIVKIFSSPENLAEFINRSECDYTQHQVLKAAKKAAKTPTKASELFWTKYNKDTLAAIKIKYKDHKQLTQDFQTMSMTDFETRYELVDA